MAVSLIAPVVDLDAHLVCLFVQVNAIGLAAGGTISVTYPGRFHNYRPGWPHIVVDVVAGCRLNVRPVLVASVARQSQLLVPDEIGRLSRSVEICARGISYLSTRMWHCEKKENPGTKAYSQRIVTTRPLYRLQHPVRLRSSTRDSAPGDAQFRLNRPAVVGRRRCWPPT